MLKKLSLSNKTTQIWIIICLSFAAIMCTIDAYIVNISLPTISHYFNVSITDVANVSLVYFLVITSTLIIIGKIADRFGLKKILIMGFAMFTLGSLLAGVSTTFNLLIVSRCVQGLGSAMLYATVFSLISKTLPAKIRGTAFGVISTFAGLGTAIGAPLGGVLTGMWGWHSIFLINIPLGIIAIIVSLIFIPADELNAVKGNKPFDVQGSILLFLSLLIFVYGLNNIQALGITSMVIISCFIISILLFGIFIYRELHITHALFDFKLFKNRNFTFANVSNLGGFMLLAGSNFILPFYLILVKGMSPETAGMLVLVFSAMFVLFCPFIGRLSDKVQPKNLCVIGMVMATITCFVFAFTLQNTGEFYVVLYLMLLGLSYAFYMAPNNNLVMSLAPLEEEGVFSAFFKTINNLGILLGVCFFNLIFSFYSPNIHQNVALTASSQMQAFSGFYYVYIFGGIICLIAAIFAFMISKEKAFVLNPAD